MAARWNASTVASSAAGNARCTCSVGGRPATSENEPSAPMNWTRSGVVVAQPRARRAARSSRRSASRRRRRRRGSTGGRSAPGCTGFARSGGPPRRCCRRGRAGSRRSSRAVFAAAARARRRRGSRRRRRPARRRRRARATARRSAMCRPRVDRVLAVVGESAKSSHSASQRPRGVARCRARPSTVR